MSFSDLFRESKKMIKEWMDPRVKPEDDAIKNTQEMTLKRETITKVI